MLTWGPKNRGWESHVLMLLSSASSTGRSAGVSGDRVLKGGEELLSKLVLRFLSLERYIDVRK